MDARDTAETLTGKPPRILFVEDERTLREHLAEVLSDEYRVETAADGEQALLAVLRARPDLVVTDLLMPGLDGIELVKMLRSTPSTAMIPILMISGRAPEELRIEGFEEGADAYLAKPYTERELRARIRSMLLSSRLRIEAARREAHERAERKAMAERAALLESITDAFYALDRQWRFTYVNQRALDYYGKCREDLMGKVVWEVFPMSRGTIFQREYERAVREQRSVAFETVSPLTDLWVDVHAYPTSQGLAVNFRDITDRKLAEASLRDSELRFRSMADAVPVLIWRADPDNRGTWFNKPWLEFTGRTLEQELGYGWAEVVHPDDHQRALQICHACLEQRVPLEMEFRMRRHDGEYRWMLDRGMPVFDGPGGSFSGYIGTCVDITERKLAEAMLLEGERRKDEFLATLAHELRNPLAPIRNGLQILRLRVPADATIQRTVNIMDRQMRHLVRLVDDLLDVSRISRGKLDLRRQKLLLTDVLASAVEASSTFIENHGHQLRVDVRADGLVIDGDPNRLAQVFSNLLSNSAKYTDRGGQITLTLDRDEDEAVVSVRDSGIGIPPEALEHVFEMFSQVNAHQTRSDGGLGIGLALVRTLVEMHDGSVSASSAGSGHGSTFTVRLPIAESRPRLCDAPSELAIPSATTACGRRRVLVVDDNTDAAVSLAMILELGGDEVRTAADGEEAVKLAREFVPHIVFMDIGMPHMDGLEATRRIRALTHGQDALIVALTGWGQETDRQRTRNAGIDHHLVKPVSPEALRSVLIALDDKAAPRGSPSRH